MAVQADGETARLQQARRPAIQFYVKDWMSHPGLRMCTLAARGLWLEMMCIMHECTPYGYLAIGGKGILPEVFARRVGESEADVLRWLTELETNAVFARDPSGIIYSPRMLRDEHNRQVRGAGGVKSLDHPNVPKRKVARKDTFERSPASASASAVASASSNTPPRRSARNNNNGGDAHTTGLKVFNEIIGQAQYTRIPSGGTRVIIPKDFVESLPEPAREALNAIGGPAALTAVIEKQNDTGERILRLGFARAYASEISLR